MTNIDFFLPQRPRRLRSQANLRALVRETRLHPDNFILPLFIHHGEGVRKPITSLENCYQLSLDQLPREIEEIRSLGIKSVILFGIPAHKDLEGSDAFSSEGIIAAAIKTIKRLAPELLVIADTCFCEYTSHGHCGVIKEKNTIKDVDNDETLLLLGKQAVTQAEAGADMIAPSGMMDGMVLAIRQSLDQANYSHIPILSYAVKYSSSFYGPFRDAAGFQLEFGDRNTYQMDPANGNEALKEIALDVAEGADMIMVKPAHSYLDIIYRVKEAYPAIPLGAYHVSGEYAMLKAAAKANLLDERKAVLEIMTGIKRAGADFIITYYAKDLVKWLS